MSNEALDRFAQLMMAQVRDNVIDDWNAILNGKMKGPTGRRVQAAIETFSPDQINKIRDTILPDIIDSCLHDLFLTLDGFEEMLVQFDDESRPANIIDRNDSLQNQLFGPEGWIARYSQRPSHSSE
jgi:hypothetical protein